MSAEKRVRRTPLLMRRGALRIVVPGVAAGATVFGLAGCGTDDGPKPDLDHWKSLNPKVCELIPDGAQVGSEKAYDIVVAAGDKLADGGKVNVEALCSVSDSLNLKIEANTTKYVGMEDRDSGAAVELAEVLTADRWAVAGAHFALYGEVAGEDTLSEFRSTMEQDDARTAAAPRPPPKVTTSPEWRDAVTQQAVHHAALELATQAEEDASKKASSEVIDFSTDLNEEFGSSAKQTLHKMGKERAKGADASALAFREVESVSQGKINHRVDELLLVEDGEYYLTSQYLKDVQPANKRTTAFLDQLRNASSEIGDVAKARATLNAELAAEPSRTRGTVDYVSTIDADGNVTMVPVYGSEPNPEWYYWEDRVAGYQQDLARQKTEATNVVHRLNDKIEPTQEALHDPDLQLSTELAQHELEDFLKPQSDFRIVNWDSPAAPPVKGSVDDMASQVAVIKADAFERHEKALEKRVADEIDKMVNDAQPSSVAAEVAS